MFNYICRFVNLQLVVDYIGTLGGTSTEIEHLSVNCETNLVL
jgi:hypothetical protein